MELYKPQPLQAVTEAQEREALNRTRTWIVCFYLDESISVHFGRPVTIARDDAVIKVGSPAFELRALCSDRSSLSAERHQLVACKSRSLLPRSRCSPDSFRQFASRIPHST